MTSLLLLGLCFGLFQCSLGKACYDVLGRECFRYKDTDCVGPYETWARANCSLRCGYCPQKLPCEDDLSYCSEFGKDVCQQEQYGQYMREHCRKFCDFCKAPTEYLVPSTLPTTTPEPTTTTTANNPVSEWCVDKLKCWYYSDDKCVGVYESWARVNCPYRCGYCPGLLPPCEDMDYNCAVFLNGSCTNSKYKAYMREHCRRFCNECQYPGQDLTSNLPPTWAFTSTTPTTVVTPSPGPTGGGPPVVEPTIVSAGPDPTIAVPLPTGEDCKDAIDCSSYSSESCVGVFKTWAIKNCPRTCRYCTGTSECMDYEECDTLPDDLCSNPTYRRIAETTCRKFCKLCTVTLVPTKPAVTGSSEPMMVPTKAPASQGVTGNQTDSLTTEAASMATGSEQPGSEAVSMPTKTAVTSESAVTSKPATSTTTTTPEAPEPTTPATLTTTTAMPFIPDPITVNEPRNGQWSYWDDWSDCSVSCGGGVRSRHRNCTEPPPENGGDDCVGIDVQTETCNSFMCADCTRLCPWGGTLSKDCSVCNCADTIAYGKVTDDHGMPVGDVNIYIQSRQWEPLTKTNAYGLFTTQEVCLMDEQLVFKKEQFMESMCTPVMRNVTHWICDISLKQTVPPSFTTNPKDKVRMSGQGVVLCCKADGQPDPIKYTWIKDGKEIKGGINGEIHIGNLQESHSGIYSCRVETIAGITTSKEATLTVHPKAEDTCSGKPDKDLLDLPDGCFAEESGTKITRVNMGRCNKKQCITSNQTNAVNCYDAWPKHCCVAHEKRPLTVNCTSFSYSLSQTISCKCGDCASLRQISGEVYGMQNGEKIPFKFGEIYIKGKLAGETNDYGFFSLTVSNDDKEVVLEVKNDIEDKFMGTIKTVKITDDGNVLTKIVVPVKPNPISFNANLGHSMPLSGNNQTAFSHVSFPSDAIVTEDGKPFTGMVKATVHFMDPRNIDDMESAYGSLSTIGEDGTEIPLETYGMIETLFNDDKGNKLKINSPVTYSLDASTFNISVDENGNSEIYFWFLDLQTGKWIQSNRFKVQTQRTGKRRLLATTTLEVKVPPQPDIKIKEEYTRLTKESQIRTYVTYRKVYKSIYNFDKIIPVTNTMRTFVTVKTRAERDRVDACVVAVKVYQDTSLQLPLLTPVTVTAITYNPSNKKYSGKDSQTTVNGKACLTIFCDQNVTLYAQQTTSPVDLVTSNTHSLPSFYARTNINRNTRVMFEAVESGYDPLAKKYSPVRFYSQKSMCLSQKTDRDDYHFQFAPVIKPEVFSTTYGEDTHDKILSWYPDSKDKPERRSCFVKVRVAASADFPAGMRLIAKSYQKTSAKIINDSTLYGAVDIGPIPDMSLIPVNFSERAACLEFRCPGVAFNDKTLVRNLTTQVFITTTSSTCRFIPRKSNLGLYGPYFKEGVSLIAYPDRNYGPIYGIYISNGPKDTARNLCYAGSSRISNVMKTDESKTLGTFKCA